MDDTFEAQDHRDSDLPTGGWIASDDRPNINADIAEPDRAQGSATMSGSTLKTQISALTANFSIELLPTAAAAIPSFADLLPRGTRVFLPHLPGHRLKDILEAAWRLSEEGMIPVPHIAARRLSSLAELEEGLATLRDAAALQEALVIAGDIAAPLGPFSNSLDILETGMLTDFGVDRVYLAAHPDGSPDITPSQLMDALRWKQAYADAQSQHVALVTQLGFSGAHVIAWQNKLRDAGISLPVQVGLAGPAKLMTLLKFARMCGVSNSTKLLKKHSGKFVRLASVNAPDGPITQLAAHRMSGEGNLIAGLHFYTFGGFARTCQWVSAVRQGDFTMYDDNNGFRVDE